MATSDRVARLRLRFETSQQDIQRAKSALSGLNQEIADLEAQQRKLDAQYARSLQTQMDNARALNQSSNFVSNLRSDLAALANEQENVNRAQETTNRTTSDAISLYDRYRRAVESATTAEQRRSGSVSAGTAGRLEQVDRFGRVGTQILSGLGQGEAANAAGLIGDVADSFTKLNPVMLGITAATVGFAIVLGNAQRQAQQTAQAIQRQIEIESETRRFIANATREELVARRDTIAQQLALELQLSAERQRDILELRNSLNVFDTIRAETGLAFGELQGYNQAAAEQAQIVANLTDELNLLSREIDDGLGGVFILVDAINATRQAAFEAGNAAKDLSIKQAEQARTAQEAAQALANANSEKQKEIQLAREAAAAASEAIRQQGITDITNELFEAQTAVVQASQRQTDAQNALAAAQGKVIDTIGDLEASAEKERTANVQEAADQRTKIAQESEDRILDITRKAGLRIMDAVGNRDALAAKQAADQAKEQISDEKKAASKRLADLDDNLRKQNRLTDERLQERIRLERIRGAEEINAKRQALLQAQTDLRNANNAELLIRRQANIILGQEAFKGGQSMVAFFKAGVEQALRAGMGGKGMGGSKPQTGYFYTAPQFSGTLAPSPNLNTPFQFTGGGGKGGTPNISYNITGITPFQLQKGLREKEKEIVDFMFGGRQITA